MGDFELLKAVEYRNCVLKIINANTRGRAAGRMGGKLGILVTGNVHW